MYLPFTFPTRNNMMRVQSRLTDMILLNSLVILLGFPFQTNLFGNFHGRVPLSRLDYSCGFKQICYRWYIVLIALRTI
jgi:hypothetical protein